MLFFKGADLGAEEGDAAGPAGFEGNNMPESKGAAILLPLLLLPDGIGIFMNAAHDKGGRQHEECQTGKA